MTAPAHLTHVHIMNYKSITGSPAVNDVDLQPLVFLVGPNGSGKSNFLDALAFVRDALTGTTNEALQKRLWVKEIIPKSLLPQTPDVNTVRVPLKFVLKFILDDGRNGEYILEIELINGSGLLGYSLSNEKAMLYEADGTVKTFSYNAHLGNWITTEPLDTARLPFQPGRLCLSLMSQVPEFKPIYDFFSRMSFFDIQTSRFTEPASQSKISHGLDSSAENIVRLLHQMATDSPENLDIIQYYLRRIVPKIERIEPVIQGPYEFLTFFEQAEQGQEPQQFYARNISNGTLHSLAVLTALFQQTKTFSPTLVGIEEPENFLHPGAAAVLREAIVRASTEKQVIITTHSPDLLDDFDLPENCLKAVSFEDGATRIRAIDWASREIIRQKISTPGELLRQGQLVTDDTPTNGG